MREGEREEIFLSSTVEKVFLLRRLTLTTGMADWIEFRINTSGMSKGTPLIIPCLLRVWAGMEALKLFVERDESVLRLLAEIQSLRYTDTLLGPEALTASRDLL